MVRFGPAGWSYRDWVGVVYPAPKPRGFDPLEYLASYFDTIEVNSTFYRPAAPDVARAWTQRVEINPDFRFTAKLWRRFTHQRKETWTAAEVAEVARGLEAIQNAHRLGAVLLQFPWSFRHSDESRSWLDDLITAFHDFPLVIEVRHASWNHFSFFRELIDRGVGFVNIDQPLFRDSIGPSAHVTSGIAYIRVHGRNYRDWWRDSADPDERYDYLYTADELAPWSDRAVELADDPETEDVYVVTNNHYRGKAVANALMLESMVKKREVSGPPPLFAEYREILERYARPETHAVAGA